MKVITVSNPAEVKFLSKILARAAEEGNCVRFSIDGGGIKVARGQSVWTWAMGGTDEN